MEEVYECKWRTDGLLLSKGNHAQGWREQSSADEVGCHISDNKTLASAWRIAEQGNIVQFGPGREHNAIKNITSRRRAPMTKTGWSYVLYAEFLIPEGNMNHDFLSGR